MDNKFKGFAIFFFFFDILICFAKGQRDEYDVNLINFHINIEYNKFEDPEIYLKTFEGCSKSEFKIRQQYYDDKQYKSNNFYIINSKTELEGLLNKYFDLPHFEIFSDEFFNDYYLVFIPVTHTVGISYQNERIEQENNEYKFIIESWHNKNGPLAACQETIIYILKIPKQHEINIVQGKLHITGLLTPRALRPWGFRRARSVGLRPRSHAPLHPHLGRPANAKAG
jgi:hypothetical protein